MGRERMIGTNKKYTNAILIYVTETVKEQDQNVSSNHEQQLLLTHLCPVKNYFKEMDRLTEQN